MSYRRAEIEGLIVGECIAEGTSAVLKAMEVLDETDFEEPSYSILFRACTALVLRGTEVDLVQVGDFLGCNPQALGGHFKRLTEFTDTNQAVRNLQVRAADVAVNFSTNKYTCNLQSNCNFLRKESKRSRACDVVQQLQRKLMDGGDVEEAVDQSIEGLLSLAVRLEGARPYTSLEGATLAAINETEREMAGEIVRQSTGFTGLNQIIYGLERGRLYAIAAEEKVGKSLFANQLALNSARNGHATAIISLEMRSSEIAKRLAGVNTSQDIRGRLDALKQFREDTKHLPLFIRDGSANHSAVLTTARKLYAEKSIELLIVDYLQLVELSGKDRVNEINDFVGRLKGLAMDLEIPVVLIAAVLNKRIEGRAERKPCPADIRDTGRLANDADCMMFLWKPDDEEETYVELFVARSRYSRIGRIGLCLNAETLKFSEVPLREVMGVPLRQWRQGG